MEIKAKLNKPYTAKQRADFIVENNHKKAYKIKETEEALLAIYEEPTVEQLSQEKRAIRNQYLTDSDKYMLPDFPVSDEERALWVKYREYLRNITKDPNFPNVDVLNFKNWKEQINDKEVENAE